MPKKRTSWIDPDAFRTEDDARELGRLIVEEKEKQKLTAQQARAQAKLRGEKP